MAARKILVVDDEPLARRATIRLLTEAGYQVSAVATAEKALRACLREQFDGVVLDARLPGIDGAEAVRLLRSQGRFSRVVVASSYGVGSIEAAVLSAGALALLRKPLDIGRLIALLGDPIEAPVACQA